MERDLYEILGVTKSASADELKKAHRGLVRTYHPDVNKDPGADARFKEIQDAYDILSDPEKRKLYDQFGIAGVRAGAGGGAPGGGRAGGDPFGGAGPFGGGGGGQGWQNVDPSTFEEVFGSMFGGGRGRARGRGRSGFGGFDDAEDEPHQGTDAAASETVDFLTAALGGTRSFRVNGEAIEVRIPAGIRSGAKLAVRGKGGAGARGGQAGDLIITITVTPHPWFRREENDVLMDVPLNIAEAALGTTVRVPLLQGSVQLKVPAGVKSGQRLRVKGKGIAPAKGTPGDFYAVIQVEAPREMDAQTRGLVEELAPRLANPRSAEKFAPG
ncbi:MAG: DnaJ C-terminal domain-containing protein [Planctomycetota bacterium]